MTCRSHVALAVVFLAASAARAQDMSGVASPNPAPPGATVALTITAINPINLPSSCVFSSVHQGTPSGPVVTSIFCLAVITPLAPGQTLTQTWQTPASLLPDTYYFRVSYYPPGFGQLFVEWFPVRIQDPGAPTLASASGAARIGQPLVLTITSPGHPGASYVAAASLTTNTGFLAAPGLFVSLDPDLLFSLSFPVPHPLLFSGFQGTLDASGTTTAPTFHIPSAPSLLHYGFHVQAFLAPLGGAPVLTNPLSFTIAL